MPRVSKWNQPDGERTFYMKYLSDCLVEAELNELFARELVDAGYASCTLRRTATTLELTILCADPAIAQGQYHYRLHQLEYVIASRLKMNPNSVNIWVDKVLKRGLSAEIMAENLRAKLEEALPIRRAAYSVIRTAMKAGAAGCEVIISGKLRAQRARASKFREGCLISTGHPKRVFLAEAIRHIKMRQGVIGIKVRIYNPNIKGKVMPDKVEIFQQTEEN